MGAVSSDVHRVQPHPRGQRQFAPLAECSAGIGHYRQRGNRLMKQRFDPESKYGRLQPIRRSERKRVWVCRCDCGNEKEVFDSNLASGRTVSCGCKQRTHGLTNTAEYIIWREMRHRCRNPNHGAYPRYGGRGITVCERWDGEDGFVNFLVDMGHRPSPELSLERRENNAGYSPENCYWGTKKQQARNRSDNRLLTHAGRTQCLTAWAEELNMEPGTIHYRLRKGWTPEATLTTPVRPWGGRPRQGGGAQS